MVQLCSVRSSATAAAAGSFSRERVSSSCGLHLRQGGAARMPRAAGLKPAALMPHLKSAGVL